LISFLGAFCGVYLIAKFYVDVIVASVGKANSDLNFDDKILIANV